MNVSKDLWSELWVSLGSLLRSYTAAHSLHNNIHAAIEIDQDQIVARHGERCLELMRTGAEIIWKREDGSTGTLRMTPAGRLQSHEFEEELDMAAEAWARELMQ